MIRDAQVVHFVVPGDPLTRTGGYLYDRRIALGLESRGWQVEHVRLDASFPAPDSAGLRGAREALAALPDNALTVIDGLALGAMPGVAQREAERLQLVGLVHHPLSAETGLSAARRLELERSEREALGYVRRIIVTSELTRRALNAPGFAISEGVIGVAVPGTDPAQLAQGSAPADPLELLCVATLTPRKGHPVLLQALARVEGVDWRLTCAGDARRDPSTAAALRDLAVKLGIADRVSFTGELDEAALGRAYHRADLFVLATWYEGYGMAAAEALARGLAVVGTRAGAMIDTVPADAGVLVTPGDVDALTAALQGVLGDPDRRAALAAGARRARLTLDGWEAACARFEGELELAAGRGVPGRLEHAGSGTAA